MLTVRKRLNVYEYRFEIAKINNKRRWKSKSGFKTKSEAIKAGISAYNEYMNTGHSFEPTEMSYCDFLDYWIKEYCNINLKYHTIEAYNNIIKNHIKPTIGFYKLSQINPALLQEMINHIYVEKGFSKNFLKNIIKVIKGSFSYATDAVGFIKYNPALKVRLPKYDIQEKDPVHIITKEEIEIILNRMKNNRCAYYALLTAYYTGLRISEVFGLTWDDIDLVKKTISINKNIIEKNQIGSTKKKHLSGNSTTVWYFGTCKTKSSYRTINIGDTLVNALKNYKKEQEENEIEYGNTYMLHYIKEVVNKYNNKPELKIVNVYAELDVPLQRVNLVFVKNNGVFQGTATMKYPFKIIHCELGIPCRFHDLRETHATKLIECGGDVKAIAFRLGHSSIGTTYDIYVRVTNQMKNNTVDDIDCVQMKYDSTYLVEVKNVELSELTIPKLDNSNLNEDSLEYYYKEIFKEHTTNMVSLAYNVEDFKYPYIDKVTYLSSGLIEFSTNFKYNGNFVAVTDAYNTTTKKANHIFVMVSKQASSEDISTIISRITLMYSVINDSTSYTFDMSQALKRTDYEAGKCRLFGNWCVSTNYSDTLMSFYLEKR